MFARYREVLTIAQQELAEEEFSAMLEIPRPELVEALMEAGQIVGATQHFGVGLSPSTLARVLVEAVRVQRAAASGPMTLW